MTDRIKEILDMFWEARSDFIEFHIMEKNYSSMIDRQDLVEYEQLTGRKINCCHEKRSIK